MTRAARGRLGRLGDEDGFTLVELLVASAMGVVLLGAVGALVLGALHRQPEISERSANVQTARWVMERLTREIRNGVAVDSATASSVSFRTYVRRTACGGSVPTDPNAEAIVCEVTYTCTTTSCSRIEAAPGVYTGTPTTIFSGINSSDVFCYVPSTNPDPLTCGPAASAAEATFVGVNLRIPNPSGPSALTASDGASLRNATLSN
jgi:prepilin-type N-terminal cleavage/methylation domain-containing protein